MSDNDVVIGFFLSVVAFYSACMAFANLGILIKELHHNSGHPRYCLWKFVAYSVVAALIVKTLYL